MGRGGPGTAFIATRFDGRRWTTMVTGRLSSGHRTLDAPATARENLLVRLMCRPKVSVSRLILLVCPLSDHCQCACFLWESQLSAECEEIEWARKNGTVLEFERTASTGRSGFHGQKRFPQAEEASTGRSSLHRQKRTPRAEADSTGRSKLQGQEQTPRAEANPTGRCRPHG